MSGRLIGYPTELAELLGISDWSMKQLRAKGDTPRLFAITTRRLVTTPEDVRVWLEDREVLDNYRMREPTAGSGRAAHDIHRTNLE